MMLFLMCHDFINENKVFWFLSVTLILSGTKSRSIMTLHKVENSQNVFFFCTQKMKTAHQVDICNTCSFI